MNPQKHSPRVYGALANAGMSNREIAAELGIAEITVRRGLAKLEHSRRYELTEPAAERRARYEAGPAGKARRRRGHVARNVERREALIERNQEVLTSRSTSKSPKRTSPGTRFGALPSTGSTS